MLYEYDLETSPNGKTDGLVKRIVNTYEYHQVSLGLYPSSFHDFVMYKVMYDYHENRKVKVHVDTGIDLNFASNPSGKLRSQGESERSSWSKSGSINSDDKDNLHIFKEAILGIVNEEFEKAGRFHCPNLLSRDIVKQLVKKYFEVRIIRTN